jgi:hypothetical protein
MRNYCNGRRASGESAQALGAHWLNYDKCADCGKRIKVMRNGRLYPHGTKRAKHG